MLVLTEDERQMFRYHVLINGKPVGEPGFLGAHDRDCSRQPVIAQDVSLVTVSWKGALSTQFVEFDVQLARATHGGAIASR